MDLLAKNLTGALPIIKDASKLRPTPENHISLFDYANKYAPELIPQLIFLNGDGRIVGFVDYLNGGRDNSYASDVIQHAEMGRSRTVLTNVSVSTTEFTSTIDHQLRVNDVIRISNGTKETQAIVSEIVTSKKFKALNDRGADFTGFTTGITVLCDYSSRFNPGTKGFEKGRVWNPDVVTNYTHILKEFYDVSESEMAQISWIDVPGFGPCWFNLEMELTNIKHDNKVELTTIFNERATDNSASAAAGFDKGMKGVVQMVEERGNIANDYIETLEDLGDIARRIIIEGSCREVTIWGDHQQMLHFNNIASGVNAAYAGGASYGLFNNNKEMAIFLDFQTIKYGGVTFHFRAWELLDDPTLMGATNFLQTGLGWMCIPVGVMDVTVNGAAQKINHFNIKYRRKGIVDRRRKTKFYGLFGTEQKEDRSGVEIITEMTAQLAGANSFYVGRRSEMYS